jgi:hypothetical protein
MSELSHARFLKLTILISASVILAMLLTMPSRALFPELKPITLMALIFGLLLLLILLIWYLLLLRKMSSTSLSSYFPLDLSG